MQMRALGTGWLLAAVLLAPLRAAEDKPAESKPPAGKPAESKRLADDDNLCIQCHENQTDKGQERFFVTAKDFAGDIHWQKGLRCQDCHGGDPTVGEIKAHQANGDFRVVKSPADMTKFCGSCHKQQALDLIKGVHDKAGAKDERGQSAPLTCKQCHGPKSHHIVAARDSRSPVFLDNQVKTCGGCHPEHLDTYTCSAHGLGLYKLGLLSAPACANCHAAHGIYRAPDERSTLHATRVAATCGKCHRFVEQRLQASVHGHGAGPLADRNAKEGKENRRPTCTTCHQGHDLPNVETAAFRQQLPNRCGNCHAKLSGRYAMTLHGHLTELGYNPAAKCSDCHGAHDILPVADAASQLAPDHRAETCRRCHPHAAGNFLDFDPHADYTDAQRSPLVHAVYVVLLTLLFSVFGFFGLHSLLWLVRGLADVMMNGRPKGLTPGGKAYVRFLPFHRVGHALMLVSFLGLAATGLPLKYSQTDWAKGVAAALGGFNSTGFWHRCCALMTFACFLIYAIRLARLYWAGRRNGAARAALVFGPDSPLPNFRDVKDFFRMVRWFFGLGPRPTFERWAYWEKFDFWGAAADILIIGSTGLVLWFPNFFCRFLPATTLNIAQVIHSTQALLATGFVFAIHFYHTLLRPEKFPVDMSMFTGLVSEEEFLAERRDLYERLRPWQGALEPLLATVPGRTYLWTLRLVGFSVLAVGLLLLAGMIVAGLGG
jgi:cytochrome b subunit of formate dehydrogenase